MLSDTGFFESFPKSLNDSIYILPNQHVSDSGKFSQSVQDGFDAFILNVRGLTQTKCDILSAELSSLNVSIILLTETWCVRESVNSFSFPQWTNVSAFCRTDRVRGGVGIWLENGACAKPLSLDEFCVEMDFEACGVKYRSFYIICCYRSPSGNFKLFLEKLEEVMSLYARGRNKLVLAGDFNVDLLVDSRERLQLEAMLSTYNLKQHVRKPTRVEKWSLLDHFYTNFDLLDRKVDVLDRNELLSDHSAVV